MQNGLSITELTQAVRKERQLREAIELVPGLQDNHISGPGLCPTLVQLSPLVEHSEASSMQVLP